MVVDAREFINAGESEGGVLLSVESSVSRRRAGKVGTNGVPVLGT